jgi:hypothetical protein
VIGAAIWGITIASKQIKESVQTTKEKCVDLACFRLLYINSDGVHRLKSKGLDITGEGISVKTSRRFDRGDYVDATQRCEHYPSSSTQGLTLYTHRGFIKAMNASSFGSSTPDSPGPGNTSPVITKTLSEESLPDDKRKKGAIRRAFTLNKETK